MNNKNCGSQLGAGCQGGSTFVPVNGNWDFNMDGCQRQNRCNRAEATGNTCWNSRPAECVQHAVPAAACTGRADCACETCARRREAESNACAVTRGSCQKNACTGRADCACETCARRREAESNACAVTRGSCQKNACTGRADCVCETCARRREAESNACSRKNKADNRGVGIVWAWNQVLDDVYGCGRALKAGTLYPELHKPMNGYYPCDEDCGDRCQQIAFAMWELRLYLNTHPKDQAALALLHRLQENCCEPNYATTFLEEIPCTDGTRNPVWRWPNDPWPWEYEANCGC